MILMIGVNDLTAAYAPAQETVQLQQRLHSRTCKQCILCVAMCLDGV